MAMFTKQQLCNIWNTIHEKFKQHWGWVEKKGYLYKKNRVRCHNTKRTIIFIIFWDFLIFDQIFRLPQV